MRLISLTVTLALVAAASGAIGGPPGTDNCHQPGFNACNANLGSFWHTDMSHAWTSLDYLTNALDAQIRPPYIIDNYVQVCNGLGSFYACLGQYNIKNCLGTIGLLGMGMSPTDAYTYEGYLAAWRFKCGGGFFMVYENAGLTNCTQNTHINYKDDMTQFITSYVMNTLADPSNACTYAQTLMDQIGGVYANGPCRTVDQEKARVYGCQSIREYTNAQFSHCRHVTTCKKSSSPANFVRESPSGPEFLLPEHYEKNGEDWIKVAAKYI